MGRRFDEDRYIHSQHTQHANGHTNTFTAGPITPSTRHSHNHCKRKVGRKTANTLITPRTRSQTNAALTQARDVNAGVPRSAAHRHGPDSRVASLREGKGLEPTGRAVVRARTEFERLAGLCSSLLWLAPKAPRPKALAQGGQLTGERRDCRLVCRGCVDFYSPDCRGAGLRPLLRLKLRR